MTNASIKKLRAGARSWPWLALAVTGITLLGAALRLVDLNNLPPGQYLDEALVNLLARDTAAAGQLKLYFPTPSGGYHPAVVYLAMLGRWLSGGSPFALRYGIALISTLSLPLFFLSLRAIFQTDQPGRRADWLALAGALIMALTVGYIFNSRNGFEVTLPTPLAAAAFLFLAQALRTGQRRYFVWTGVAVGLALYTYLSARLLPLAVAAAMLWVALRDGPASWRRRAGELALIAGVALLVFAPLGGYFIGHPSDFLQRALATSGAARQGGWAAMMAGLLYATGRTLGGLVLPGFGDSIPRHNLPGRPLFDAFVSVGLALGALLAVRRPRRTSHILLLSWAALLLVPAIVTLENNSPHFTRLIAATPALAGLAALGLAVLYEALCPRSRWLAAGVVSLGLLFSLAATSDALFLRWGSLPEVYDAFLVGDWRAASLALERTQTQDVYLSPELISDPQHASFNLLLRAGPVRDFPGPVCLLYRDQPARPQTYLVFAPGDPRTADRLLALFPTAREAVPILHQPNAYPDYRIIQVPAGARAVGPQQAANVRFGSTLTLLGYDLSAPTVAAGGTLTVTLYWQALQPALADYSMFVHLYWPGGEVGAAGVSPQPVAQDDGAPCDKRFLTPRWQPGEVVVDERALTVPASYSATTAALGLGVYAWPSLVRLPVSGNAALLPGNRLSLGTLAIGP